MHADHVLYLQCKMTDMGIAAHMEHMSEGRSRFCIIGEFFDRGASDAV